METPWGRAQQRNAHPDLPIVEVATAGHGGLLVDSKWGRDNLSEAARRQGGEAADGALSGRWYYFEEQVEWAVLAADQPAVAAWLLERRNRDRVLTGLAPQSAAEWADRIASTLGRWGERYLAGRGLVPGDALVARLLTDWDAAAAAAR